MIRKSASCFGIRRVRHSSTVLRRNYVSRASRLARSRQSTPRYIGMHAPSSSSAQRTWMQYASRVVYSSGTHSGPAGPYLTACGLRLATVHGISRAEVSVPLSKQAPAGGVGGAFAGWSESDGRGQAGQAGRRPPPPPERPRSAGNSLRPREECRCRPAGPGAAPSPATHTARTAVGSAPDSPADRQFHGFHLARSIASRMPTCNAGSRPELACVLHLARPPTPREFVGRCISGDSCRLCSFAVVYRADFCSAFGYLCVQKRCVQLC